MLKQVAVGRAVLNEMELYRSMTTEGRLTSGRRMVYLAERRRLKEEGQWSAGEAIYAAAVGNVDLYLKRGNTLSVCNVLKSLMETFHMGDAEDKTAIFEHTLRMNIPSDRCKYLDQMLKPHLLPLPEKCIEIWGNMSPFYATTYTQVGFQEGEEVLQFLERHGLREFSVEEDMMSEWCIKDLSAIKARKAPQVLGPKRIERLRAYHEEHGVRPSEIKLAVRSNSLEYLKYCVERSEEFLMGIINIEANSLHLVHWLLKCEKWMHKSGSLRLSLKQGLKWCSFARLPELERLVQFFQDCSSFVPDIETFVDWNKAIHCLHADSLKLLFSSFAIEPWGIHLEEAVQIPEDKITVMLSAGFTIHEPDSFSNLRHLTCCLSLVQCLKNVKTPTVANALRWRTQLSDVHQPSCDHMFKCFIERQNAITFLDSVIMQTLHPST